MKFILSLSGNTQGILCLLGALAFLTVSDSIIKWLSPELPLHEITLIRGIIALVIVLFMVQLEGGMNTLKTRRPWLHFLRGSMLVLANMFFFLETADCLKAYAIYINSPACNSKANYQQRPAHHSGA